jgi:hypothetical protein
VVGHPREQKKGELLKVLALVHALLAERILERPGFLLFQNPMLLQPRGLLRARSRFPEIVENSENRKQRMESLECRNALAKQVLSQLSYTPTVRDALILKHFRTRRNPFLRITVTWSEPLD